MFKNFSSQIVVFGDMFSVTVFHLMWEVLILRYRELSLNIAKHRKISLNANIKICWILSKATLEITDKFKRASG